MGSLESGAHEVTITDLRLLGAGLILLGSAAHGVTPWVPAHIGGMGAGFGLALMVLARRIGR